MKTEIINIGDELLIGQVVNTNAAWMAEQLNLAGFIAGRMTVIPDDHDEILKALGEAGQRDGLVLITGGLGPTKDDITKNALCGFFGTKLVFSPETYANIEKLFGSRHYRISESDRRQAEVPEGCRLIPNRNGTAPGMWFEGKMPADGGKRTADFIFMPGVPFEMKAMMEEFILPELKKKFPGRAIVHRTVLTQGIGESSLAGILEPWETNLPQGVHLAYLPQPGIVRLRLTSTGDDMQKLAETLNSEVQKLEQIIPDHIFGYEDDSLEEILGNLLLGKQATLATAESITGGTIAQLITSVPGCSRYFRGSVIAYSNELKEELLGVSSDSLAKFGAVSEPVAREMAAGAQKRLKADYVIAVTGIAGPEGGTPEKPVGTTWIAVATPDKVIVKRLLFGEHRGRNIRRAALEGMNMLRKALK